MTIVCTLFGRLPGLHPGNRPLYSVQKMPVNQRGKTYPLVAVGLAAFLVFANSLSNGLVYDDHFLIERNRLAARSRCVGHFNHALLGWI